MGEVYRAVDTRLRRKVALKVLRPDTDDAKNPDGVARLFREARAAAGITHPNTVAIHDLGESDGLFYIVMELVIGQPLLAFVGDERVSLARRLKWLGEIARALATAHKAGVIHRDVKPSNVMVTEEDVAKVLDFGLAKPMPKAAGEPESFGFKTAAGRVLGTVRYMAPEQMIGSDADGRSDQYALGMTAFELLAGRYPTGNRFETPPLLNTVITGFPADGAIAIARMLKRIPEDRFPSMEDVASAFEDIAANRPVRALGIAPGPKPARVAVVVVDAQPVPDKTALDPPDKHPGPETVEERQAVGSTLTSVEDEFSADTVYAIEDALQPTVSPSELAATQLGGSAEPLAISVNADGAKTESTAAADPAPGSKPVASKPAISTLQSADAGDRVRKLRESTGSQKPKEPMDRAAADKAEGAPEKADDEKPASKPVPKIATTLASGQPEQAVIVARNATAKNPKAKAPLPVESVPPPKKTEVTAEAEGRRMSPRTGAILLLVVIIAAYAGYHFGQKGKEAQPAPPDPSHVPAQ